MSLSIVVTGRDDNYEGDFLYRLFVSILSNITTLDMVGIEFEYIVVEWCPFKDYLINHNNFTKLFGSNKNLRSIIVDKSVSTAENLYPNTFYEYFGKNAGIRTAKYDNILLTNSDILINEEMGLEIKGIIDAGLDPTKFYRPKYRDRVDAKEFELIERMCLHNDSWADAHLCGAYSGDFLLAKTNSVIEMGQGYDEINPNHRSEKSQTNMDGEILSNMYHAGMRLEFLKTPYQHIEHSKNAVYDGGIFDHKYNNKNGWGFVNYQHEKVGDQLEIIKA